MSTLPMYVWRMVLAGLIGTTAIICAMLSCGALTARLSSRTATAIAAVVGIGWGAWVLASALLANADVYRLEPGKVKA
jgi:integral membrane sensor domain MASE1